MPAKKVCLNVLIKVLIFVILFTCFVYFFLKDQMATFMKGRTTITKRVEMANSIEFPTITICLDPPTKLSVAKKFGFTNRNDKVNIAHPTLNLPEVFDEMAYQLDSDYSIMNYNGQKIKLGLNDIEGLYIPNKTFQFEAAFIRTYHYGTCIKLEPRFNMTFAPIQFSLLLKLNSSLEAIDRPESVVLLFTSGKTWLGILDNVWPQFKPLKSEVKFIKEYTHLSVQPEEEHFLKYKSNDPISCFKRMLDSQNCSKPCTLASIPDVPICQTVQEYQCSWNDVWSSQIYYHCLMPQKAMTYTLQDRVENAYHKDRNALETEVYIGIGTLKKIIKEEVFLLNWQDLIGSVGGSLGLFFGFSFSATIVACLNACLNKLLE